VSKYRGDVAGSSPAFSMDCVCVFVSLFF
jgi:hypothetical protein